MSADPELFEAAVRSAIDGLGGYEPMAASAARPIGTAVFLITVIAVGWLERLQFSLKRLEGSRWWASNGRDVLNVIALLLLILALRVIGIKGPLALCMAATVVIVLSAVQLSLSRHRHQAIYSVLLGLLLSAPVLIFPAKVDALFTRLLTALFT